MDVLIKKFSVRRNGITFLTGDIIKNLSQEEAEKLSAESNGTIILLDDKKQAEESVESDIAREVPKAVPAESQQIEETEEAGLPSVDPQKAVGGNKKK